MSYKITKVIKRNTRTGEIAAIYPSPQVAAEQEGVLPATIVQRCHDGKDVRGYTFHGKRQKMFVEALCWRCAKACGGCSWSHDYVPVEGWEATRRDLTVQDGNGPRMVESYLVRKCPEFTPDPPRQMQFAWMDKQCVECASLLLCAACGPICKKRSKT